MINMRRMYKYFIGVVRSGNGSGASNDAIDRLVTVTTIEQFDAQILHNCPKMRQIDIRQPSMNYVQELEIEEDMRQNIQHE